MRDSEASRAARTDGGAAAALPRALPGIAIMVACTLGFSIAHTLIRVASADFHPFQVTFFRNFFGLLVLLPWFVRYGLAPLRTRRLGLHLTRVSFSVLSLGLFYYALSIAPLARVTALGFITPVIVTLLAALFLGETVDAKRWAAIGCAFAGALVIVRPGLAGVDPGSVLMIVSSLLFACALFVMKILTRTESAVTMTSYAILLMTPLSLLPALAVWQWPAPGQLPLLVIMGVISAGSVLGFTAALARTATHVIMPFDYLRLIWMAAFGYILFGELPDGYTWVGGTVIFAAATFVTFIEYRNRQPAVQEESRAP